MCIRGVWLAPLGHDPHDRERVDRVAVDHGSGGEDLLQETMEEATARAGAAAIEAEEKLIWRYKAVMRGGQIVVAERFFASSKPCSACERKLNDPPLSVREWICPACGAIHGRDVNAAINLKNMAVSSTVAACAAEGSGEGRRTRVKAASAKQEISFDHLCA